VNRLDRIECDLCAHKLPPGTRVWGCKPCNFDMCRSCLGLSPIHQLSAPRLTISDCNSIPITLPTSAQVHDVAAFSHILRTRLEGGILEAVQKPLPHILELLFELSGGNISSLEFLEEGDIPIPDIAPLQAHRLARPFVDDLKRVLRVAPIYSLSLCLNGFVSGGRRGRRGRVDGWLTAYSCSTQELIESERPQVVQVKDSPTVTNICHCWRVLCLFLLFLTNISSRCARSKKKITFSL
jgi:hypothetical protein